MNLFVCELVCFSKLFLEGHCLRQLKYISRVLFQESKSKFTCLFQVCLFVCLFICLFICLFVCLFTCLFVKIIFSGHCLRLLKDI